MKKLILLGLTTVLFISCQQKEAKRYFSESPEIDVTKALLKDYHAGDWEAWTMHYADTAKIFHNSPKGASPKETIESLTDILSNTSSYKFNDDSLWYEMVIDKDDETWVNFWGNWEGKLAANGQELIIPVHLTLQFVDGKIVQEYGYYNTSEIVLSLQAIAAAKAAEESEESAD